MTQPCVKLLDTHELRLVENLCHGNVLVTSESNFPRIYLVKKFIKKENSHAPNLRIGAPMLEPCLCNDVYRPRPQAIEDVFHDNGLDYVKVVTLHIPETECFVNAFLAYKTVIAELREMDVATCLIVLPDDEHVKQICGYFDSSWHSVEFLHLPCGSRYVTVNYCVDENTGVSTSSDVGFEKLQYLRRDEQYCDVPNAFAEHFRRNSVEGAGPFVRERSWDCLEPCVSVIFGVTSIKLVDVNEILMNFGLIDYKCMNNAKRSVFSEHDLSLKFDEFERTVQLFCVYGRVSIMKSFILELKELREGCVVIEKWLPYDKHFDTNYLCDPLRIEEHLIWSETRLKRRRNLLISVITVFCKLDVPPYVILEILDWITFCQSMQHREKIDLIFAVQNSIKKISDKREDCKKIKL